jgi:hypothetical protein
MARVRLMGNEFTVVFDNGDAEHFPDTVRFRIEDNAVLTISDGDEKRRFSPHAWREVRGGGKGRSTGGEPGRAVSF